MKIYELPKTYGHSPHPPYTHIQPVIVGHYKETNNLWIFLYDCYRVALHDLNTTSVILPEQTSFYFGDVASFHRTIPLQFTEIFLSGENVQVESVLNLLHFLIRVKCINFCSCITNCPKLNDLTQQWFIIAHNSVLQLCLVGLSFCSIGVVWSQSLGFRQWEICVLLEYTRWFHLHVWYLSWDGWNICGLLSSLQQDN